MGVHVFPILNPPLTSLPNPSLWVYPVHQPQTSCIMHWIWTGDSFHIWYYTCFNAILPIHPTLSLSHRVQKTVLYTCVRQLFYFYLQDNHFTILCDGWVLPYINMKSAIVSLAIHFNIPLLARWVCAVWLCLWTHYNIYSLSFLLLS